MKEKEGGERKRVKKKKKEREEEDVLANQSENLQNELVSVKGDRREWHQL